MIAVTGTVVSTQKKTGTVAIMFTSKSYFGFHPESSMILQCKSVTLKSLKSYSAKKKKKKKSLKSYSQTKKSLKSLLATPKARLH